MEKTLNILSMLIKILTVGLGTVTAADASVLHLTVPVLGSLVGGLGTAGIVVKALQSTVVVPK